MSDLPRSIAAYPEHVSAIRGWLAKGWLDQDTFDREAEAWSGKKGVHAYTGDTIILPSVLNWNAGKQQDLLAVLQEMLRVGLVEGREKDGKIEYRLA